MENASKKIDYRKTLNLPRTDFAMKADLAQREPSFLEKWQKLDIYKELRKKLKGKPKFILHDGPPYANGPIHIGHALNKTLKDMIVKYRAMKGLDSDYLPGWDCHGLPIEHQLFKELKTDKSKVECVEFRRKAHDYAMKYVGIQREEFRRLGIFGNWENPYLTLTPDYEYWILKSLTTLTKKEYIYRGLKPVNWCFHCETALAEAEVEYENHISPSVYVKFRVNNPETIKGFPKGRELFLLVWTTAPWTLPANAAIAVHPKFEYCFFEYADEVLIIEKTRSPFVLAKEDFDEESKEIQYNPLSIKTVLGSDLTKLFYVHPFGKRKSCPVVTVDYVTREDGTGLVHTAPGHGQEDYETGRKYNLDIVMPVDDRGCFTEEGGEFKGLHVFKANEKIIERLKNKGILFAAEKLEHSYPHCWRCKSAVISRATEQWFLKIDHDNLRSKLIEAVKTKINWIPSSGMERILGMVETRPDWCLSRQRCWGVPIPSVVCKACGGQKLFPEIIERFAEIVKKEGSDAWFLKKVSEFVPKGFVCPQCRKSDFEKPEHTDILDVWFDSGVSHQAVVKGIMGLELPIDLYLEGSDQHRGWFQSSLIPAVAIEGKPPYKAVLTHGFVVDGQGRKMSKSLGNVAAPQDIIKNYGADILRLWAASSSYNEDIRISKEILERLIDAYRKIRNTIRYILSNLYDFNPEKDRIAYEDLADLDRWALYRLSSVLDTADQGYGEYDFARVYQAVYSFCNGDLSSIYLDILKDRLYTFAAQSQQRRAAQTVLYDILDSLVRIMAPILAFTAEEAFEFMPKAKDSKNASSVHLLDWPVELDEWKSSRTDEKLKIPLALRSHVQKFLEERRQAGEIGSPLDAKIIFETASEKDFQALNENKDILAAIYIVSQVEFKKVSNIEGGVSPDFPKTRILIKKAGGKKCSRCWNYSLLAGRDSEHPALCERCVPIVKEINNVKA